MSEDQDGSPKDRKSIARSLNLSGAKRKEYVRKAVKMLASRYSTEPRASYQLEIFEYLEDKPLWIVDRVTDRELGITAQHRDFPPSLGDIVEMVKQLLAMEARAQKLEGVVKGRTVRNYLKVDPPPTHRYLNDPHLSFQDCPRLAAAFWKDPEVTAILMNAPAELLRKAVKAHAEQGKAAAYEVITGRKSTSIEVELTPSRRPSRPYPKLWAAFADDELITAILDNRHPDFLQDFDRLTHYSKTLAMQGKEAARTEIMRPRGPKGYIPPLPKWDISELPPTTAHSWSGDDLDPLQ